MLALKLALLTAVHIEYRPPVTILDVVSNGELWVGAVLIILFTLLYGLRFRWTATTAGVSIFSLLASLSLLMIYSVITRLLTPGDYPLRDVLRLIVYFTVPASATFLFIALFISRQGRLREIRVQRKDSIDVDQD